MAWDFRIIMSTGGRRRTCTISNVILSQLYLCYLFTVLILSTKLTLVASTIEFSCDIVDEAKDGCNCEKSPETSSWTIECPRGAVEVPDIKVKVTSLKDTAAYLNVECDPYDSNKEMAWKMLKGLDFEKLEQKFNVTGISLNKCSLTNNTLEDFFAHVNLRRTSMVSLVFLPPRSPSDKNANATVKSLLNFITSLENLETLDLKSNKLKGIPNVSNLTKLREIILMDNQILEIPPKAFSKNQNLKLVELGSNKIVEIPEDVFPGSLLRLFLRNNKISKITSKSFSNLKKLELLTLRNNPLTSLDEGAFSELSELKTLDLYSAHYERFPILRNLSKLQALDLSYRDHSSGHPIVIPSGNSSSPQVAYLKMESLPINFNDSLQNLEGLETLTLSKSGLNEDNLPNLQNFPKLMKLKLDRNNIKEIPKNSFRSGTLINLDLSQNEIQVFEEILMPHLEELDLSQNKIKNITAYGFAVLEKLVKLKLNKNLIEYIHQNSFDSLQNLKYLDLSDNKITTLSRLTLLPAPPRGKLEAVFNEEFGGQSVFKYCMKLEELYLSHNKIDEIYVDWKLTMPNLRVLSLSHNNLTKLFVNDINFFSRKLKLDLSFNQISSVTMDHADLLLDGFENHDLVIKIDDNPLNCDCNLLAFKKFNLRGVTFDYKNLNCFEPPHLKNISISKVKESELECTLSESFGCPNICTCNKVPGLKSIVVDCSFRNLTNFIPNIRGLDRSTGHYKISLNLAGNSISSLNSNHTKNLSENVSQIDLSGNELEDLSFLGLLILNNETMFYLAENNFICSDCDFHKTLRRHFRQIADYKNITCLSQGGENDGQTIRWFVNEIPEADICVQTSLSGEVQGLIITFGVITILLVILIAIYIRHGWALRAFLYSKGMGCCLMVDDSEDDTEKIYDAFVSFSHKDEEWVLSQLVNRLEEDEGFKLCLHFRDWTPGDWIPDQIVRSVDKSRRTVVILSKNFVESIWSRLEFKAAHSQALNEKGNRLILILMGEELEESDVQDEDLKVYMKMNTYLKWGDPWFWHKLKYALPHKKSVSVQNHYQKQQQRERAIQLDKLRSKMENSVV